MQQVVGMTFALSRISESPRTRSGQSGQSDYGSVQEVPLCQTHLIRYTSPTVCHPCQADRASYHGGGVVPINSRKMSRPMHFGAGLFRGRAGKAL